MSTVIDQVFRQVEDFWTDEWPEDLDKMTYGKLDNFRLIESEESCQDTSIDKRADQDYKVRIGGKGKKIRLK